MSFSQSSSRFSIVVFAISVFLISAASCERRALADGDRRIRYCDYWRIWAALALRSNQTVRNVNSRRIQSDEIWQFCCAGAKNVPERLRGVEEIGDVWTWVAIDADSKLAISYLVGGRDAEWAHEFIQNVASRVSSRIQLTTDGHRVYAEAVENAFGSEIEESDG